MNTFSRFGLVRPLLSGGGIILLTGMLVIGTWISRELESGYINHLGSITSFYMESFISPHVQSLPANGQLSEVNRTALDGLLSGTPLGRQVVAYKLWAPDGRVLYSSHPALIGQKFEITPALVSAFAGNVDSKITNLSDPDNKFERERWPRLIETYAPLRALNTGTIIAVSEFYQTTDEVDQAVLTTRRHSWILVSTATLIIFLLLAALVKRASNTIIAQQGALHEKVLQLTALLAQNKQLHDRVRRAAARTTALNERFLHRISADLHDGPCQTLALSLMRMESLAKICHACAANVSKEHGVDDEFRTLHSALQFSLDDLRTIAKGLHLPEIERLSLSETARRAVRDYERKTGLAVPLTVDGVPDEVPLPVKITLFRLLQESLANGFRHGGAPNQRVELTRSDAQLVIEVADSGKGFDPQAAVADDHLGLTGMRERVEILGGTFSVQSSPGKGTVVRAALPLASLAEDHE